MKLVNVSVSMTYMCQTTISILALLSLMLMILPSLTLCSKTFKMSLHMQRIAQLLYLSLLIMGAVVFFFFKLKLIKNVDLEEVGMLPFLLEILCCLMNLAYVSYLHYVTVQYCNKEQPIRMQIVQKIMNTIVPII
ncbi:unnamed protein product (macronuclear) [Paramecium tetraurelia]|uniref:Uncharacterized protein n=1 Tax=Paramecium tetraurelia TaxID=5888 RepID=A0C8J7_PARTE|nr:uncharacterized protein GSPATT00036248001 [Paramecium tetraurelia]CAK67114.1 unnamed protein product [Paramecium tetraurelia]|eukprot:XP_001434511.1 hypothetical protein (macronuclear) [Paramecium tetraurelia strain d4-2]